MKNSKRKNQKGMATIETLSMLGIFLVLVAYGVGMFSYVHTAVLYSISARNYAFETFRNRTNLRVFRDNALDTSRPVVYLQKHYRTHSIQSEQSPRDTDDHRATLRPLAFGRVIANNSVKGTQDYHNKEVHEIDQEYRKEEEGVSPAWIMISHGICLNAGCGGR